MRSLTEIGRVFQIGFTNVWSDACFGLQNFFNNVHNFTSLPCLVALRGKEHGLAEITDFLFFLVLTDSSLYGKNGTQMTLI